MSPIQSWQQYRDFVHGELTLYASLNWRIVPMHRPMFTRDPDDWYTDRYVGCTCGRGLDCSCVGKHPLDKNFARWASSNPRLLTDWNDAAHLYWQHISFPGEPNWAVLTGACSGVTVLDVDPKNGGVTTFSALQRRLGHLPETTPRVWSGSHGEGAFHYYFRFMQGLLSDVAGLLGPGIDLLSDGGRLAVLPPSLHRSGHRYEWMVRPSAENLVEIPPSWAAHIRELQSARQESRSKGARFTASKRRPTEDDRTYYAAVHAYNLANTERWPRKRGPCPMCGSPDGFVLLSEGNGDGESPRWDCKSTRHQVMPRPPGHLNVDGSYSGTQLDIDSFLTGQPKRRLLESGQFL